MVGERIKMKKIDDAAARQLTFSKRRRGLFKKAEELAVLCDAEVALIIFCTNGKLCEYCSSSSMKHTISRYDHQRYNVGGAGKPVPPLHVQPENSDRTVDMSKGMEINSSKQRRVREEDIQGLNLEELHQLEKIIQAGLNRVLETKEERMMGELATLRKKADQLNEANTQLKKKKKMALVSQRKHGSVLNRQKDSADTVPAAPPFEAKSSDTSLKLGLPFPN